MLYQHAIKSSNVVMSPWRLTVEISAGLCWGVSLPLVLMWCDKQCIILPYRLRRCQ